MMRTLIRQTAELRIRPSSRSRCTRPSFLCLLWLCCWLSTLQTASAQTDGSNLVPELAVDGFVDVEFCYASLDTADLNEDDEISMDEYVVFIQSFGPDGFVSFASQFSDLPLTLTSNFNILACLCKREGLDDDCCVGQNSHLEASGSKSDRGPTEEESSYLFLICSLSSGAIDRVLDSKAPTEAPTSHRPSQFPTMLPSTAPSTSAPSTFPSMDPTMSPTAKGATRSPSATPTTSSPTVDPVKEIVVNTIYQIGIFQGTVNNVPTSAYEDDLVAAMNSLGADSSSDSEPGRRRKLLRSSRDLQTVSFPTNINGVIETICPANKTTDGDRCEDVTASIILLFQPEDEDIEGLAQTFKQALEKSINDGGLQKALDVVNPDSPVFILNSAPLNPVIVDKSTGVGTGGIAGIVAAAVVGLLIALLLSSRKQEKSDPDDLLVAPLSARLDEKEEKQKTPPRKLAYDTKPLDSLPLGATTPDYGKQQRQTIPDYEKQMADSDDEIGNMSDPADAHDSSSNAGSSGWSSSAGVSSLNTGSADGLDDPIVGIAAGSTLAGIAAGSARLQGGPDSGNSSLPSVSRADLDSAIEAGDWAAVGATAALLAAASDSQSYSSRSGHMSATPSKSGSSVSSFDAARAAELDHLVDAGDWEGVVLAAAKYEAAEGTTGSRSEASEDRSGSITGSGTYPSVTTGGSQSSTHSKIIKRQELRAQVEDLVQRVVPEEIQNVDEMMLQFRGREEELVETLRTMQERAVAQKARQGAQKAAKQQAKRSVNESRASGVPVAPASASKDTKRSKTSPQGSKDMSAESGSFPHVTATSLGTGIVSKRSQVADPPAHSERDRKQTALEEAIESGDWEAVGEAAAMLSDASPTSADTDELNRLAEGMPSDRSSSGNSKEGGRAAELDNLIDKGDWTGVVAAASKYSADDNNAEEEPPGETAKTKSWFGKQLSQEDEQEERRQRRLKRMQEEQEALAQAEIWMAIAEQSKQDTDQVIPGASDAADWAIARSLTLLAQAEQAGDLQDAQQELQGARPPPKEETADDEEEV